MSRIIKEKIRNISVYQAVVFEKIPQKFFHSSEVNSKPGQRLELIEELGLVKISSDKDAILVPLANISVISLDSELHAEEREVKRIEKTRGSIGVKAQDIPRPR